ncbi:MAG: sigma-70 family RNA polymerase sigma factor [Acidobacteria bacterium]|nr:sigma-70 family RNA polymerase sigma factor [Acidobacteriota bacterium]
MFGTAAFGVITGMMLNQHTMAGREPRKDATSPCDSPVDPLLSDEPTIELVMKAQGGDRLAIEALLQRCLPQLKRWAHGKLPAAARGSLDTGDLVQEAAMHVVQRLAVFQPRHVGAMQAYLRMSVINRIRDEIRRIGRHPAPVELPEDHPGDSTSPLEAALQNESYERYRQALGNLKPRDREMVVARVEAQWSMREIARQFGMRTVDGARMAVTRALKKLSANIRV